MIEKSNISPKDEVPVTIAVIIQDGKNTGLAGRVSGELIAKLEDVLDEIAVYIMKDASCETYIKKEKENDQT